jgi:hypothetical protein
MLRDPGPHFEIAIYGCEDFHAVCGDIYIPWATSGAKNAYQRVMHWASLTPTQQMRHYPRLKP